MMISEGCQISARDKLGRTPLHYATATAQYQCVLSLVANGASLTVTDNFNRTPLHYAATSDGDAKSVRLYLTSSSIAVYVHVQWNLANSSLRGRCAKAASFAGQWIS